MAKGPKSVEAKLKEWLDKQGYPLELSVANAFRRAEFSVAQGTYYEDAQEKIAREIDVVATRYTQTHACDLQMTVVAECKSSPEKPWIVFSASRRRNDRMSVRQRAASFAGGIYLSRAASDEDVRQLVVFRLADRVGYGATQAFTAGKDAAYTAIMCAAKASADQLRDYAANWDSIDALALIVLPIVVTDARLFECYIDDAGKMQLREAARLTIGWQHPGAGRPLMFVEILRADEVGAYATAVGEALGVLSSKEKAAAGATAAWEKKQMTAAARGAS